MGGYAAFLCYQPRLTSPSALTAQCGAANPQDRLAGPLGRDVPCMREGVHHGYELRDQRVYVLHLQQHQGTVANNRSYSICIGGSAKPRTQAPTPSAGRQDRLWLLPRHGQYRHHVRHHLHSRPSPAGRHRVFPRRHGTSRLLRPAESAGIKGRYPYSSTGHVETVYGSPRGSK